MSQGNYETPLRYRDRDSERCFKHGEFLVYLYPGHSLADHSAAVGTDMATYMRADADTISKEYIVYTCKGVGEYILARIRADPGVEAVDCNFRYNPGRLTPAPEQTVVSQAPLLYSNNEYGTNVPGRHIVILRSGHSLTEHSTAVGTNMLHYVQDHRQWTSETSETSEGYKYTRVDVDDDLLGRIRQDPGVQCVACDFAPFVVLDWERRPGR
jgi:hypothetical protein